MKTPELMDEVNELGMFEGTIRIRARILQQVESGVVRTTRCYIYGLIDALEMCSADPVMITQLYRILNKL